MIIVIKRIGLATAFCSSTWFRNTFVAVWFKFVVFFAANSMPRCPHHSRRLLTKSRTTRASCSPTCTEHMYEQQCNQLFTEVWCHLLWSMLSRHLFIIIIIGCCREFFAKIGHHFDTCRNFEMLSVS